ncbi:MAG: cbb3-type cytochrome c oxidase subunit I [Saprospiraceae bacterium]
MLTVCQSFEGPMLSIKSFNAITHYTDWTIAHVHVGALGWNGLLTFGMLYWLIPRIYNTKLYSVKSANIHFWISTLGILVLCNPIILAGLTQSRCGKRIYT